MYGGTRCSGVCGYNATGVWIRKCLMKRFVGSGPSDSRSDLFPSSTPVCLSSEIYLSLGSTSYWCILGISLLTTGLSSSFLYPRRDQHPW
jgi:hypothetical protein